jgi:hypothetical protein
VLGLSGGTVDTDLMYNKQHGTSFASQQLLQYTVIDLLIHAAEVT